MNNHLPFTTFTSDDIHATQPALKIGLLATINPQGLPHLTMLSSLMAYAPQGLCFGQFTEGESKHNIQENPHAGFMIMSLDKQLWRGTARFIHTAKQGVEYNFYNQIPMFRYNAYFGVHTVYYLDLVAHTGKIPLPMNQVVIAAIKTMMARTLGGKSGKENVLNPWTQAFFNKLDNLKFLSYLDEGGFPVIIPVIQIQALDSQHMIFSTSVYKDELTTIPAGASLAVFGLALSMEDVLLRGVYQGIHQVGRFEVGIVKIDWVYNSMPPVPGQIYPRLPIEPVREF
jgi:hypothetical protein